nr:hypothetical protein 17 [bacterium]
MPEIEIKLQPYQDKFLFSKARYPCLIGGVATGKTMVMLMKCWRYCEEFPDSLCLVVRKTFRDLQDSTMADFQRYFGVKADSNGDYIFPNGSKIMFRHSEQLSTIKNLNLSCFFIEQAEEIQREAFTMLRDRLRRETVPGAYRQGVLICNSAGHNWIYQDWISDPPSKEYEVVLADTFMNSENLPQDFLADLRTMEQEAPHHYRRFVMNDFSELESDDMLFTGQMVYGSPKLEFTQSGYPTKILGCDVARFGDDSTVFSLIQARDRVRWEQIHQEAWKGKDTMQVCGKIMDLIQQWGIEHVVIDEIGLGSGVVDRLTEQNKCEVYAFNSAKKASQPDQYANQKAEAYFKLREMFSLGHLKILDDRKLHEELLATRFLYKSNGARQIVSKDQMRKDGLGSPDRAEALCMACFFKDVVIEHEDAGGFAYDYLHPAYSKEEPLF